MQRRANAHVRLRTGHDELADPKRRENSLEVGAFERVAIMLRDDRFTCERFKLRDDSPCIATRLEFFVSVLDPDDRHLRMAGSFDEQPDGGEHFIPSMRVRDDAVLKIDDDKRGVRAFG